MKQFTLNSFKSESKNLIVDGSEPIIHYTVTDYKQTDSQITIAIDFVSEESIADIIELIDNDNLNKACDRWNYITVTGSCKFFVDITGVEVDDKHLYITTNDINPIDGKIISIKLQNHRLDHNDYSEEKIQKIESILTDYYKENSTKEFTMIASYCILNLV